MKTQKEQELEENLKILRENKGNLKELTRMMLYKSQEAELKGIKEGKLVFAKVSSNYSVGFKEGKVQAISEFKEKVKKLKEEIDKEHGHCEEILNKIIDKIFGDALI